MQYLILILALVFAIVMFLSLGKFVPSDDADEALSEALLRELSDDIEVSKSVEPTATNPVAVSQARAAEAITDLPEVLAGLRESGVSVADLSGFQENVQQSVEELIAGDEEPGDIRLEPLSAGLAAYITESIVAITIPISRQISRDDLPETQRVAFANEILDEVLAELAENDVPPAAAARDDISRIVEQVVDVKRSDPEFGEAIEDEQTLKNELTVAISGLEGALLEGLPSVVAGLPPVALNLVAEVVVEQIAAVSAPEVTERIVEEGLNPGNSEDAEKVNSIVDESVSQAVQSVLPNGELQQLELLTIAIQEEQREAVIDNDEDLATAPTPNDGTISDKLVDLVAAVGTFGTIVTLGWRKVGPQARSPNISVGEVLSPEAQPAAHRIHKIHHRSSRPIAFKLAYAGTEDAILETVEFRAKLGLVDSFKDSCFRLTRLVGPRSRSRHWVRAQHAQKSEGNPYGSAPEGLEDLSLPMILHTGDQLFISARALLGETATLKGQPQTAKPLREDVTDASDACNGAEDNCPEVDMVSLGLRGNVLPQTFRIDHWEQ